MSSAEMGVYNIFLTNFKHITDVNDIFAFPYIFNGGGTPLTLTIENVASYGKDVVFKMSYKC